MNSLLFKRGSLAYLLSYTKVYCSIGLLFKASSLMTVKIGKYRSAKKTQTNKRQKIPHPK